MKSEIRKKNRTKQKITVGKLEKRTMKVLVVSPHPDDEVLGVGGTMARLASEGNDITVAIVTK